MVTEPDWTVQPTLFLVLATHKRQAWKQRPFGPFQAWEAARDQLDSLRATYGVNWDFSVRADHSIANTKAILS